jgi:hypothetical protein
VGASFVAFKLARHSVVSIYYRARCIGLLDASLLEAVVKNIWAYRPAAPEASGGRHGVSCKRDPDGRRQIACWRSDG